MMGDSNGHFFQGETLGEAIARARFKEGVKVGGASSRAPKEDRKARLLLALGRNFTNLTRKAGIQLGREEDGCGVGGLQIGQRGRRIAVDDTTNPQMTQRSSVIWDDRGIRMH